MSDVRKIGMSVRVSAEQVRAHDEWQAWYREWVNLAPEERARRQAENLRRMRAERLAERESAPHVPASLAALGQRMGWGPKYTEHLCQPYCECAEYTDEGWHLCAHARDLGISESD